jgi:hypothetical protein
MQNTRVESARATSHGNRVVSFAGQTSDGKTLKSTKASLNQSESHYRAEIKRIKDTIKRLNRFKLSTGTIGLLGSDHQVVFVRYLENRLERLDEQYECYKCNVKAANMEMALKDIDTRLKLHTHSLKHHPSEWEYRTLKKWSAVPTEAHKWTQPVDSDTLEILKSDKAELINKFDILDQRFGTLRLQLEQNGRTEQSQGVEIAAAWKLFDVRLGVKDCTHPPV